MTKLISNILCPPCSFTSFLPFEVVRILPNLEFEEDGCAFWDGDGDRSWLSFGGWSGDGKEEIGVEKANVHFALHRLLCTFAPFYI